MSSSRSNSLHRKDKRGEEDDEDRKPPAKANTESSVKSKREQFLDQVCREIILIALNVFFLCLKLNRIL